MPMKDKGGLLEIILDMKRFHPIWQKNLSVLSPADM